MIISELETNWEKVKGKLREKFSKLTNEDLAFTKGKKEPLIAKLIERHSYSKDQAERELHAFASSCDITQMKVAKAV